MKVQTKDLQGGKLAVAFYMALGYSRLIARDVGLVGTRNHRRVLLAKNIPSHLLLQALTTYGVSTRKEEDGMWWAKMSGPNYRNVSPWAEWTLGQNSETQGRAGRYKTKRTKVRFDSYDFTEAVAQCLINHLIGAEVELPDLDWSKL